MAELKLSVNGRQHDLSVDPDTPLLWVLREGLQLTGTKFSCGAGLCGACTVLLDGAPVRSCTLPVKAVAGQAVVTIEGLSSGDRLHPVQQAWLKVDVPQCGYCQCGQILSAVALLRNTPRPSDADIDAAMTNICRCGAYPEIRAAIHLAAAGEKQHADS